ncbi:MAG: hypothetical protein K2R93_17375 [Gemmatimonadaceae bacterium]|nr:hypothetical protein [Gemmatimonadaceae bacterium]
MRSTRVLLAAALLAPLASVAAQSNIQRRDTAFINRSTNPALAPFRFRSIGPASMGGRIDDIAVYEKDPRIIYIGYAAGGVFKSTNAGTTFVPIFEQYGSASIGDLAVDQRDPNVLYVGTGEPNNRQSATFGDGLYKSTDGGKTFAHIGLRETQTIARVVIDPRNSNTVYVAATGHLFGPNAERGVFKSTDAGKTWSKVLFVDEHTGATDLAIDPSNPNTLYAAMYQRRRTGCCFNGAGPGSGLYKSDNGGKTWTKLTTGGLPPGNLGRIAVDVARSNPSIVYAQIETDGADSAVVVNGGGGGRGGYDWCSNGGATKGFAANTPDSLKKVPALSRYRPGLYRSNDKGRSWTLVSNCNGRPMYFSNIRIDPTNPQRVYLANVRAAKSVDGGRSFAPIDSGMGFGNETVDQHAFWIDPANPDHIMRGSDAGFAVSWDQGETWEYVKTMATSLAYWVSADMERPYNVYFGLQDNDSWGGPSAQRSRNGIRNFAWHRFGGGDGFQTAVSPMDPTLIFTESQDGNTIKTDLTTGAVKSIRPIAPPAGRGGANGAAATPAPGSCVDGRIIPPPTPGANAAPGGGFGGRGGGAANVINGKPGETYRFNWNTPYQLSPHDPSVVWLGGNRLFRSTNQGDLWYASEDLTKQVDRCTISVMGVPGTKPQASKNDGMTSYSTIIAVRESPVRPGVVWAGTDDGNLQVSRDNGVSFTEVGKNITGLPAKALTGDNPYWISRIEASHFDAATAYVSIDGHRSDDLTPYVFVTRDYGATWKSVSTGLPRSGNVQTIREDPKNPDLLYAGTEFGIYISLDAGATWDKFMTGYPTVRTDEILVHPRDGDLIVASHGRSIWIADDITPLQQLTPAVRASEAHLFDVRPAVAYLNDFTLDIYTGGEKEFEGENPARGTAIHFWLKNAAEATLRIADATGRAVCEQTVKGVAGMNRVQWTLGAPMLAAAPAGRGGAGPSVTAEARTAEARTAEARTAGAGTAGTAGAQPAAAAVQPVASAGDRSCTGAAAGGRGGAPTSAAPGSYTASLTVGGKTYTNAVQVLEDRWMRAK